MNRIDCIGYDPVDCERYDCDACASFNGYDEEEGEEDEEHEVFI